MFFILLFLSNRQEYLFTCSSSDSFWLNLLEVFLFVLGYFHFLSPFWFSEKIPPYKEHILRNFPLLRGNIRTSHSGHLRGNRNNKKFSKTQILIIWSKFIKIYLQWSKIDQFRGDLTAFAALKFGRNDAIFILFANFNQF